MKIIEDILRRVKQNKTRFWVHEHLYTHLRASECEAEINRRKEAQRVREIYTVEQLRGDKLE